jgi:uncharacterized protein YndB with AHSA1/START domain
MMAPRDTGVAPAGGAGAAAKPTGSEGTLRVRRIFNATRDAVFRAWTDPRALVQWWMPKDGFSVPSAHVDLRVGGRYRVAMRNPAGEVFHLSGTYREVAPPARLVYTWNWEDTTGMGETLVTVEFRDLGATTEVVLTHELPDAEQRDRHGVGWGGCLDRLAVVLAG